MGLNFVFWSLCGIYLVSWLFFCLSFFRIKQKMDQWGGRILFLGLLIQLVFITISYIELDEFVFSSVSGLLLFLSLLLVLIYFILNFYFPNQIFGVVFPPLVIFFLLLSALISDQQIVSQVFLKTSPVVGKTMLYLHASFSMLGYLLFGVAGLTAFFFLYQEKQIKNKTLLLEQGNVPSLGFLGAIIFKVIIAGFLFLTVGLMVGISMKIIAHQGIPRSSLRQVLPTITWAVYAVFLIDRSINGLRGKISAIWAIAGFLVAISSFVYEITQLVGKH